MIKNYAKMALITGDYLTEETYWGAMNFLNYLIEAGVDEIMLASLYENGWLFKYAELPKTLWEESLLKAYTYYYHSHLKQLSKPTTLDIKTGKFTEPIFYNEMRIQLSLEDVISYMYQTVGTLFEVQLLKRDREGLRFILDKHKIAFCGPLALQTIDVIYMMFDMAKTYEMAPNLNFLELFNQFYTPCLISLEEMHIAPQKHFTLRTGELITCRGK